MGATLLRQWLVLTMLPIPPRRIDTASIERRLRARGIEAHRRTIQRDLVQLAHVFPIVADETAKPYGWRWSEEPSFATRLPSPPRTASGSAIQVSLRVRRSARGHVLDQLGAWNQQLSDEPSDEALVAVSVLLDDSDFTRRILLGHGDELEVVAPLQLRREIAERARLALAAHAG